MENRRKSDLDAAELIKLLRQLGEEQKIGVLHMIAGAEMLCGGECGTRKKRR